TFLTKNVFTFLGAVSKRPEIAAAIPSYLPAVPQLYADVDRDKASQQQVELSSIYTHSRPSWAATWSITSPDSAVSGRHSSKPKAIRAQTSRTSTSFTCAARTEARFHSDRLSTSSKSPGRNLSSGSMNTTQRNSTSPVRRVTVLARYVKPWKKRFTRACPREWVSRIRA